MLKLLELDTNGWTLYINPFPQCLDSFFFYLRRIQIILYKYSMEKKIRLRFSRYIESAYIEGVDFSI
jgi:hypothetical protein